MKRMIICTWLILGFALVASSQTANRNSSPTTRGVSTTKAKKAKKNLKPSDTLNNRKAYMFKNGQRSTPTGAEAAPSSVGGQYAAVGRTRHPVVKKDTTAARKKRAAARRGQ